MSQDCHQGGVCEENLWMINSSQNLFRTSPCSSSINDFVWSNLNLTMNMEASREENNRHNTTQKPADFVDSSMSYPYQLRTFNNNTIQDSSYDSLKSQAFLTNQQQTVMNPIKESEIHDFPLNPASSYDYSSSIMFRNLFDMSSDQPLLDNLGLTNTTQTMNSHIAGSVSFPTSGSYAERESGNNLQFVVSYNNSTGPYWGASTAVTCDVGASVLSSTQPQFVASSVSKTTKLSSFAAKRHNEVKKAPNEQALKRKKTEAPSPLPTFKVRKEKLGDRITALQQMVSPFGKTDTASVLHEAIEYIKFLHDQVGTLSTPYMKNASPQVRYQQIYAKNNTSDQIGPQQDLRSRGLCLVPISSTLPVASETTYADNVWTPNLRGNFR